MTILSSPMRFDRWLICSDDIFQSVKSFWQRETGSSSLLSWRMSNRMVDRVAIEDLTNRLTSLVEGGHWAANIIVENADVALIESLESFAESLPIHLVEWRVSPLATILGMNAPDRQLFATLVSGDVKPLSIAPDIVDVAGYAIALASWEQACRQNDGAGFAAALPVFAQSPIPWHTVLGEQASASPAPEAANDNWIEIVRLAAASADDADKAVCLADPQHSPAQWTLTLSPIDGGPSSLAVFRVNQSAIASFKGCSIRLRIKGEIIELGEIDDEGEVETILPSPVELKGLAIAWDSEG